VRVKNSHCEITIKMRWNKEIRWEIEFILRVLPQCKKQVVK